MKRLAFMLVALFATLSFASAEPEAKYTTVSRHYNFRDFNRLSVSHSFEVDLTFADTYSVDVQVPDFMEPYLRVKNVAGKLILSVEKLPRDVQRMLNDSRHELKAQVTMPRLVSLEMSGASRVTASGLLQLNVENLDVDLSGASKLIALEAKGVDRLSIDVSGASKCRLKAAAEEVHADISGASKVEWEGTALRMNVDCSGASNGHFNGNVGRLYVDASGSSKAILEGEAEIATVELSGVSKCQLAVSEKLDYELSGASTLRVKDLGATMRGETSRGSKVDIDR